MATPSVESSPADRPLPGTRIYLRRGSLPRPFLITRKMITGQTFEVEEADYELEGAGNTEASTPVEQSPQDSNHGSSEQSEDTPTRRNRRSFPTNFGPPSAWKNRATSLRRPKRNSGEYSKTRRYASDPTSSASEDAAESGGTRPGIEDLFTPPKSAYRDGRKFDIFASQGQVVDCPSSISSLSRLSGLHVDLSRVGPSPPSSAGLQAASPTQFSSAAAPYGAPAPTHSRAVSKEGASTLAGSEMSVPGLASGDDDTDYKSDVLFDSFRTTDTNRLVETPLDAMFDDTFPGNNKTKRLSIQEILGNSWDGNTNILEEDEGTSTPMRLREPRIADDMRGGDDRATEIAKYQLSVGDRISRLSLDTTDDDYDWARDEDEVLSNPLSPPTSSVNSRRGPSPPMRSALASISGNSASESYTISSPMERPRSNLFDWAEPPHEKIDDSLSRPKTAHGKQELDLRGGRPSNRKGCPVAHIRSQSVPVVPDPQDSNKGAPKFGTWAVGNKNVSEDWDDDFDFEETSNSGSGSGTRIPSKGLSMRVPQSIQATQPTVKAHSGQIRELSLLVSSLKRLCRQGRELNMLDGEAAATWKEAENIVALASPDEEEVEDSDTDQSFSDFDPSTIDERFLDEGFDASTLDRSENSLDGREPDISKNAVVRERQVVRRRSVFSPDDDIFGNIQSSVEPPTHDTMCLETAAISTRSQDGSSTSSRLISTKSLTPGMGSHAPRTPERVREFRTPEGTVVSSVIAAMEQQRSLPSRSQESPLKPSKAKLFFDTNSLQELVKRASAVFHTLSDLVRREELLTMSPQATPRHDRHGWHDRDDRFDRHDSHRHGGSPAFTRVFSDPDASSPRHLVKSQKSHSSMPRKSLDSNGLGQRMQMMTVN